LNFASGAVAPLEEKIIYHRYKLQRFNSFVKYVIALLDCKTLKSNEWWQNGIIYQQKDRLLTFLQPLIYKVNRASLIPGYHYLLLLTNSIVTLFTTGKNI
jgi:hypothetical protein